VGRYSFLLWGTAPHTGKWPLTGSAFVSILWAFACLTAGFLFGFLFGIPKTLQKPSADASQNTTSGTAPPPKVYVNRLLGVNTNLEEISDWLTKILVGATLTQLVKIPTALALAAAYMAGASAPDIQKAFCAALIVYFSSVGFLAGYLLTRLFFAGAFERVGQGAPSAELIEQLKSIDLSAGSGPLGKTLQDITKRISATPLSASFSGDDANAIAVSSLVQGNRLGAFEASDFALRKNPRDPWALYNRALLLAEPNNEPSVVNQLERAKEEITADTNQDLIESIYNNLIYYRLYLPVPDGYDAAIRTAQEYFEKYGQPRKASLFVNLACAYGQKYADMAAKDRPQAELSAIRDQAISAMTKAIELEPAAKDRLRQLVRAKPTDQDNDLVVFLHDPTVRQLLGMSAE
jgi:tetratricopeptide (TPR) repeat protein